MTESPSGAAGHHVSVLPDEVLEYLAAQPGQVIVVATTGAAGHASLIASAVGPAGRLLAAHPPLGPFAGWYHSVRHWVKYIALRKGVTRASTARVMRTRPVPA